MSRDEGPSVPAKPKDIDIQLGIMKERISLHEEKLSRLMTMLSPVLNNSRSPMSDKVEVSHTSTPLGNELAQVNAHISNLTEFVEVIISDLEV